MTKGHSTQNISVSLMQHQRYKKYSESVEDRMNPDEMYFTYRTTFTTSFTEAKKQMVEASSNVPKEIADQIAQEEKRAVVISFHKNHFYLNEHLIHCFLVANGKASCPCSFPRHRRIGSYLQDCIFYNEDVYLLSSTIRFMKEQFPETRVAMLPKDFTIPPDFPSEAFFFSDTAFFLNSQEFKRLGYMSESEHFYFQRPKLPAVASQVVMPGILYDPNKYNQCANNKYNFFNQDGPGVVEPLLSGGMYLSIFNYENPLAKMYYQRRGKMQQDWLSYCSNHRQTFYNPNYLTMDQFNILRHYQRYPISQHPHVEDRFQKVNAASDKLQMLDPRFRFGLAQHQCEPQENAVHPLTPKFNRPLVTPDEEGELTDYDLRQITKRRKQG